MPATMQKLPTPTTESGHSEPDTRGLAEEHPEAAQLPSPCTCDDCQPPSRDEMWTRWA
ncbi:hypothetical protein [Nocardioides sp.]|uniref:hypothetical protein n=1 Tax=Nocardioides sp. TaxID=35761 RepID=UPI002F3F3FA0